MDAQHRYYVRRLIGAMYAVARSAAAPLQAQGPQRAAASVPRHTLTTQMRRAGRPIKLPDTPLEEWVAGVDQLLQDLDKTGLEEER